ncbi:E3 binding domain-containing protein, partial [bacterium AH-315-A23]|nr:E3 binding domain-containing protein [bacterium AH-315-A23]MBN4082801.1 E3 binding domain-containing protein [bacterium AH-315-A23]
MTRFEVKLPKMGESVAEATITSWLKSVGDAIEIDEAIVEIATDKVDSEIPSEVEGTLVEILFDIDAVVHVGDTIAIIETDGVDSLNEIEDSPSIEVEEITNEIEKVVENEVKEAIEETIVSKISSSEKFYSPLVRNIAETEGISMEELGAISGTGKEGRVTKNDILAYIESARKTTTAVIKDEVVNDLHSKVSK